MRPYPDLDAAVADALKLAEGMTYKFAVTGHPRGGGKAVIAVPARLDSAARTRLLLAYGRLIAQLGGLYQTGPDVGTSPEDMDVIARTGSPHVFCRTLAAGGAGDSSLPTAAGVHAGIETVCERLFGSRELVGRRILVQGAGSVGLRLIELLVVSGARVIVADPDSERAELAGGVGQVRVVSPEQLLDEPGDVFSPCALGGVLDMDTVDRLKCRGVAGAANNQLGAEGAAQRLEPGHSLRPGLCRQHRWCDGDTGHRTRWLVSGRGHRARPCTGSGGALGGVRSCRVRRCDDRGGCATDCSGPAGSMTTHLAIELLSIDLSDSGICAKDPIPK